MKRLLLILLMGLIGCTSKPIVKTEPLVYSFIPKYLDFDSVTINLPKDPAEVMDTSMLEYFDPIPVMVGDTLHRDGILISERMASYYPFYEQGYKRQMKELEIVNYLMKEHYSKAKAAETLYQDRIVELKKENERSWLERNMGYIGFITGIATAILTELAVIRASD